MKFTFEKPFNFSRFPSILKCHEHYNQLVEESYYTEARYEDGKCSKDEWANAACGNVVAVTAVPDFIADGVVASTFANMSAYSVGLKYCLELFRHFGNFLFGEFQNFR